MSMQPLRVIKVGGNILDDPEALDALLDDVAAMTGPKILVHGGGKTANTWAKRMGIQSTMINGRRVTDADGLELVTMVYGGLINNNIVAGLQARHCNALGLSGADAGCILAERRPPEAVDYGFVGDIRRVDVAFFRQCLDATITPVVAPLSHDGKGGLLNTNADTIAAELAIALCRSRSVQLLLCFEQAGVLADPQDTNSLLKELDEQGYLQLLRAGSIGGGMLPKLFNAFAALRQGVQSVRVCNARDMTAVARGKPAGTNLLLKATHSSVAESFGQTSAV